MTKIDGNDSVRMQRADRDKQEAGLKNALDKINLDKLRLKMHRKGRSEFELKRYTQNKSLQQRDNKLSGPTMVPMTEQLNVTAQQSIKMPEMIQPVG